MDSARAALARRLLKAFVNGYSVSFNDAVQLRNWASSPEDAMLPLDGIARQILKQETGRNTEAG